MGLAPMSDAERADFAGKKSEKQRSVPFIG